MTSTSTIDAVRDQRSEHQTPANSPQELRRALMVCHDFPPYLSPGTFRALRFSKYLPEFSWEPIVVTLKRQSFPSYVAVDPAIEQEIPAALEIYRTSVWRPIVQLEIQLKNVTDWLLGRADEAEGSAGEQANHPNVAPEVPGESASSTSWKTQVKDWVELCCATPDSEVGWIMPAVAKCLSIIRRRRPEVIYTTGPPHSSHLIGIALRNLTGLPHVIDMRDPWSRVPWGNTGGPRRHRLLEFWEHRCVRGASAVVLNTDAARSEFAQYYADLPAQRFSAITNGIDPSLATRIDALLAESACDQPADSVARSWTLCHPGHIYGHRDIRPLAYAIRLLRAEGLDIRLQQIGQTIPEQRAELDRELGADNFIEYLPALPHQEMLRCMVQSDILVLLQQGTGVQIPSKLFEMVLLNKPILAVTEPGVTADIIRQHALGSVSDGRDMAELARSMRQTLDMAGSATKGTGWTEVRRAYDGRMLTARLAEVFNTVTGVSPESPLSPARSGNSN